MSFLSKARVLGRTCRFVVSTAHVNKLTPNFFANHVKIKAFPAISNIRFASTSEEPHVTTIYEGTLSRRIKYVKIFSLSTSAMALLVQPYLIPKVLATNSSASLIGVMFISGFFAFVTPIMLHMITSKYVTKMTYDKSRDVYTATIYNIFVRERQIEFTPDDVEKPGMGQVITTCYVRNTPIFFDFQNFTDIEHYSRILGYDKPLDLQLETPAEAEPKKN